MVYKADSIGIAKEDPRFQRCSRNTQEVVMGNRSPLETMRPALDTDALRMAGRIV